MSHFASECDEGETRKGAHSEAKVAEEVALPTRVRRRGARAMLVAEDVAAGDVEVSDAARVQRGQTLRTLSATCA
jgi:hypothetical protein